MNPDAQLPEVHPGAADLYQKELACLQQQSAEVTRRTCSSQTAPTWGSMKTADLSTNWCFITWTSMTRRFWPQRNLQRSVSSSSDESQIPDLLKPRFIHQFINLSIHHSSVHPKLINLSNCNIFPVMTSSVMWLFAASRPAGLPGPPWAAGCRGDAVRRGSDERGAGGGRPGRPVEAAGQLRHRAQQRGGRVRAEVRVEGHAPGSFPVRRLRKADVFCFLCCSGTWTSWCAWKPQPNRRAANIWPGTTSRPASTRSTWPCRRNTNVRITPEKLWLDL